MESDKATKSNNHPNRARAAEAAGDLAEHDHERDYSQLRAAILAGWSAEGPAFHTTAGKGLFEAFLSMIPGEANRQVHNCMACRGFFRRYGGLVAIDPPGRMRSLIWRADDPAVPEFYRPAIARLAEIVEGSRLRGAFYSSEAVFGKPGDEGGWRHIHVLNPAVYRGVVSTAGQYQAKKLQDFQNVSRVIREVAVGTMNQAMALLEGGQLEGGHRYVGPLRWLQEAKTAVSLAPDNRLKDLELWARVASAPDGFCHVRGSTLGGLLADVAAGEPFRTIQSRFAHKTDPRTHQRAQAAPAAGNIKRAEEIVGALGLAPALARRRASLAEVLGNAAWEKPPSERGPAAGGVFAHIRPKGAPAPQAQIGAPPATVTWEKFRRDVLPGAAAVEAALGYHGYYAALTAPEDPGAPPLFAWDREAERNPYSHYTYTDADCLRSERWGLQPGTWAAVAAVVPFPFMWGSRPEPHRGARHLLVLEGCADQGTPGLGLFAVLLRSELYEVRATIEAASRSRALAGKAGEGGAAGLCFPHDRPINQRLRVTGADGVQRLYTVDRWD
jgi:hypothetical protein